MKVSKVIVLIIVSLLLVSCDEALDCEDGMGPVVTRTLSLDNFHSFELQGSSQVILTQGSPQEVKVEGQANIIDLIELDVQSGVWEIEYMECVRNVDDLKIYITIPEVRNISLSGSGNITTQNIIDSEELEIFIFGSGNIDANIDAGNLNARITGSGNINLAGEAGNSDMTISGSGNIRSFDLLSSVCDVTISGSGDARVFCEDELNVTISGSGNVRYKGTPVIDVNISGSGSLINSN